MTQPQWMVLAGVVAVLAIALFALSAFYATKTGSRTNNWVLIGVLISVLMLGLVCLDLLVAGLWLLVAERF